MTIKAGDRTGDKGRRGTGDDDEGAGLCLRGSLRSAGGGLRGGGKFLGRGRGGVASGAGEFLSFADAEETILEGEVPEFQGLDGDAVGGGVDLDGAFSQGRGA